MSYLTVLACSSEDRHRVDRIREKHPELKTQRDVVKALIDKWEAAEA
jgi:hypothetical protein